MVKPGGVPGDGYGRVVYVETLDSLLGTGWWRLTGILTRNPSGTLCHAMVPQMAYSNYPNPHVVDAGNGKAYRAYTEGPGVTPLVMAQVDDPGNYDGGDPAKVQRQVTGNSLLQQWQAGSVSQGPLERLAPRAFAGWLAAAAGAFILLSLAGPAAASQLFARDATNVKLAVNATGQKALLTYKVNGVTRRLLVSGAVNALVPSQSTPQAQFNQRGLGKKGKDKKLWKNFKNKCKPYDGPELAFVIVACTAPDGSYWAVQAWKYWQPFFGYQPWLAYQDDVAFHVSHWTGPLAQLEMWSDWIDVGRGASAPHEVFARLTYGGSPVFGYVVKPGGVPGDGYGRVVYIETLDSLLGAGWWRLAGILTRNPSGMLCHALMPQMTYAGYPNPHVVDPGNGTAYRAYVEGPGVTPLVMSQVDDPGSYDPADPVKVQRQAAGASLLQQWQAPPACLNRH